MYIPVALGGILIGVLLYTDIRWLRAPNAVTVPAAVAALALHGFLSSWSGLWWSFSSLVVVFVITYAAHACKAIGAGDVKACAALAACIGMRDTLEILTHAWLAAAVVGVVVLIAKGTASVWIQAILRNIICFFVHRQWGHLTLKVQAPVHVIPFMPAIAFGFICLLYARLHGGGGI